MSIKIGDFVKGITDDYGVTNTKMTRGVVTDVRDVSIVVRVLDHDDGKTGVYTVDPKKFEIIGHQKQFDRAEVLKLLKSGRKQAILDYDLRGANLINANLRGANLINADLMDANLSGADLSGADLMEANLMGANLKGANLSDTNLINTDLSGADFRGADLRGVDLRGANLKGANLNGADLDYSCYPLWCGSLHLKADKRLACQLAYHLCSLQCDDADYIKMRNSILDFANQFHRVDECGKLEESDLIEL